jgi:hypothetical protein
VGDSRYPQRGVALIARRFWRSRQAFPITGASRAASMTSTVMRVEVVDRGDASGLAEESGC